MSAGAGLLKGAVGGLLGKSGAKALGKILPIGKNLLSNGVQGAFNSIGKGLGRRANQVGRDIQQRAYQKIGQVGEKAMNKGMDYIKEGASAGKQYFDAQQKKFSDMANRGNATQGQGQVMSGDHNVQTSNDQQTVQRD